MERIHKIAAEIFKYSYNNYLDHIGINERFDKIMPQDAEILETAIIEKWSSEKVAEALDVEPDIASNLLKNTERALEVVDAENPAQSFRIAVRQSIQNEMEDALESKEAIEQLVTQICYRAADLSVLLDENGHRLSQYSRHLRSESDVEYYDGYFDKPLKQE